eukprot:CAMPEP_0195513218 /NCGR_PEP_ID=MMETSP0794_2-20130614/4927_1 /TAXON_ID=515487 /ORGANISM="Stephanopyxis turris, Strain CCMP 815" /LENGTH=203 /DNA_ID=CAMNT_0040641173 /DNA_START=161 /DNA_END=769 /DNA_ORIENTATION=-
MMKQFDDSREGNMEEENNQSDGNEESNFFNEETNQPGTCRLDRKTEKSVVQKEQMGGNAEGNKPVEVSDNMQASQSDIKGNDSHVQNQKQYQPPGGIVKSVSTAEEHTSAYISPNLFPVQVDAGLNAGQTSAAAPSSVLVVPMRQVSNPLSPKMDEKVEAVSRPKPPIPPPPSSQVQTNPHVYHDYARVADTVGFVRKKTGGV